MKRSAFVLAALLLACPAFVALTRQAGAAADAAAGYVVVDPLDLRQPVPNPEVGLTGKYDGKTVRFTGTPRATVDKNTKKVTFELRHDIVQKTPGTGKPKVVVQETIVVPVTFQDDAKQLLQNLEKLHRARKAVPPITVQGKGAVTGETLFITDAVIVPDGRLDVSTTNRVPRSK